MALGSKGIFIGRDFSKLNGTPGNENEKRHLMLIL